LVSLSEVRALCSTGITRLPRYYGPLRGPSQPAPFRRRSVCSAGSGLPSITRTTFPACRAHYPGGSNRCLSILAGAFPHRVLPDSLWPSRRTHPVGIHGFMFRGLLRLHSRYGLQVCSPTLCGLCHEAPARMVTHPNRSSATQAYRLLLAWDFHPLVIRAIEAHVCDMEMEVLRYRPGLPEF